MKTAEEILEDHDRGNGSVGIAQAIEAMKLYASQSLDEAAEVATTTQECDEADDEEGTLSYWTVVDKQSILKLKEELK